MSVTQRPEVPDKKTLERWVRRAAIDADGIQRLQSHTRLEHALRAVVDAGVILAREQGRSWSEIGEALGVSKQAAQQRFGHLDRQ